MGKIPAGVHLQDIIHFKISFMRQKGEASAKNSLNAGPVPARVKRINDAIFLQMAALYEAKQSISVIALLEKEASVSRDLRLRSANRLTAGPVYRGDEGAAIQPIEREVFGAGPTMH